MAGHTSTDDGNFCHFVIDEDVFDRHFLTQVSQDSLSLFEVRAGDGKGDIRNAFVGNADTLDDHVDIDVFFCQFSENAISKARFIGNP
mgnify:CR=1 FL=1